MPIFEFRCLDCGQVCEKLFLHSREEVLLECAECGSGQLERVVSRASHVMKAGPAQKPKLTEKSCSPGNRCMTLDVPGPAR